MNQHCYYLFVKDGQRKILCVKRNIVIHVKYVKCNRKTIGNLPITHVLARVFCLTADNLTFKSFKIHYTR